jgi:pimeloyl-ACP methyl ester carboxylesterase
MRKRLFCWLGGLVLACLIALLAWAWTPDADPAQLRAAYANSASRFITAPNGQTLHLRDQGRRDAPVLLLLHGSNASLHTWEPWVARLGRDYRIVTVDLPGHGLAGPAPDRRYDAAAMGAAVTAVADHLGLQRFIIGGNSMGGWVAWTYTLANPNRIDGLLLVDAGGAPVTAPRDLPIGFRLAQTPGVRSLMQMLTPRPLIAASVRQSVAVQASVTDAVIDRYWQLLRFPGNRQATIDRFATPRDPSLAERLGEIKLPTLILWGRLDKLTPVAGADAFRARIANSSVVILDGVGHIPMEEAPDISAGAVHGWLSAHGR